MNHDSMFYIKTFKYLKSTRQFHNRNSLNGIKIQYIINFWVFCRPLRKKRNIWNVLKYHNIFITKLWLFDTYVVITFSSQNYDNLCYHILITKSCYWLIFPRHFSWMQGNMGWKICDENENIIFVSKSCDFVTKM